MSSSQIKEMKDLYQTPWSLTESKIEHIHLGYWDQPCQDMEKAQEKYLKELTKGLSFAPEQKVLDIGCGNGATAIWLAKNFGCNVYGIDIVESHLQAAREAVKQENLEQKITILEMDATQMNFVGIEFDYAICIEALYHIDEKTKVLDNAKKFLKTSGILILSEFVLEKKSYLGAKIASAVSGTRYMEYFSFYSTYFANSSWKILQHQDVTACTLEKFLLWSKNEKHAHLKKIFSSLGVPTFLFYILFFFTARSLCKKQWALHFIHVQKN